MPLFNVRVTRRIEQYQTADISICADDAQDAIKKAETKIKESSSSYFPGMSSLEAEDIYEADEQEN
jgi:hypothetical protein